MTVHLHNKNQPDALSFLIYFNNHLLRVSNRLTIHHQEAVYYIYAVCGIYHAENILRLCKITYLYIVTNSIKHYVV